MADMPLKLKYRAKKQPKAVPFVPKYSRNDRRKSKAYQQFCRKHPKSRA